MPRYLKSRVVGVSDEDLHEFICSICLGLFSEPMVTQCCRQTYCKICITRWISKAKTCPNDRTPLTNDGLNPGPQVLVNLIMKMKVKCRFKSDGCPQVVKIKELAQHQNVCDYRPNQLCKDCGLIKVKVSTHNCIQSLVSEKRK